MRTTARILARLLVAAVLIGALGLVALLVVVPRVSGAVALTVLSGSMEPTIPVGAVVLTRPVDPTSLEPGDVITYQAAPGVRQLITHRVVKVQHHTRPVSFITRGDANDGADREPVPVGAVRGKEWFHVPYVGHLAEYVKGPRAVGVLGILGGFLLLLHLASRLGRGERGAGIPRDGHGEAIPSSRGLP